MSTAAWVKRRCTRCNAKTMHDHSSGTSSKASWIEMKCHECSKVTNITMRHNALERV